MSRAARAASGGGSARGWREKGAQVVLFDVKRTQAQAAAAEIGGWRLGAAGGRCRRALGQRAIAQVAGQHGRLDIMVNCAGIVGPNNVRITDYSAEDFDRLIGINLRGSFLMTKYAIPHMLKRNYGRILLIASMAGKDGNPNMIGYTASKAGVIGLVKGIGKEYAETGITVNGLAPALIRTPMNADTTPEMLKYFAERIPMHRVGTVEEVAALACWIVSPEASFNTGLRLRYVRRARDVLKD